MRKFVHRENIKHYKHLLERTTDEAERQRIMNLLSDEESMIELDGPSDDKRKSAS